MTSTIVHPNPAAPLDPVPRAAARPGARPGPAGFGRIWRARPDDPAWVRPPEGTLFDGVETLEQRTIHLYARA